MSGPGEVSVKRVTKIQKLFGFFERVVLEENWRDWWKIFLSSSEYHIFGFGYVKLELVLLDPVCKLLY